MRMPKSPSSEEEREAALRGRFGSIYHMEGAGEDKASYLVREL